MRLDDRFGDYLLFRKLGASPLGSTYRAGRLQARAIDRVVLLHRYDGEAVDPLALAKAAAERAGILENLTAPHFAHGLALGSEDGTPYVAYDYLLGRTLKETLSRAAERQRPPETSYVIALVEQAAASLVAAARIRVRGVPIRHGFLVPELLLLSAEGRVYPLGFSHGAALLCQEPLRARFAPYLCPEARGVDPTHVDDVYSLAAILFEGLTGKPPDPDESTATQVDQALLTLDGAPMAPAVQDLLKSGLARADKRPALTGFHRSLRGIVAEADDSPSQFQLAFFLHRLFRDELEAEAVEMRSEKTMRFDPLVLTPPEEEPTPAPEELASEPIADFAPLPTPPPAVAGARFGRLPFLSGVALALALAASTAGALHLTRRSPAVAAEGENAARPSPETDAELRRLVVAGAADLQNRLETEYEPRLTRLRQDLLAAQTARQRSERAARLAQARTTPAPEAAAEPSPGEAPLAASADLPVETATPPPTGLDPDPDTPAPAASAPAEPASPEASTSGDQAPSDVDELTALAASLPPPRPVETGTPAEAGVKDAAPRPPAEEAIVVAPELSGLPEEPAPAIDRADEEAAEEAASYSPPRLLEPPRPRYPAAAERLRKTARVQVRVLVDAEGLVGESEIVSGQTGFGFGKSALEAAARTRWEPARSGGAATSAWAVLTIDFRL